MEFGIPAGNFLAGILLVVMLLHRTGLEVADEKNTDSSVGIVYLFFDVLLSSGLYYYHLFEGNNAKKINKFYICSIGKRINKLSVIVSLIFYILLEEIVAQGHSLNQIFWVTTMPSVCIILMISYELLEKGMSTYVNVQSLVSKVEIVAGHYLNQIFGTVNILFICWLDKSMPNVENKKTILKVQSFKVAIAVVLAGPTYYQIFVGIIMQWLLYLVLNFYNACEVLLQDVFEYFSLLSLCRISDNAILFVDMSQVLINFLAYTLVKW